MTPVKLYIVYASNQVRMCKGDTKRTKKWHVRRIQYIERIRVNGGQEQPLDQLYDSKMYYYICNCFHPNTCKHSAMLLFIFTENLAHFGRISEWFRILCHEK